MTNTKAERFLFAKIGYILDKMLKPDYYVKSEYHSKAVDSRFDMAILRNETLIAIFEGKLFYSFDGIKTGLRLGSQKRDCNKDRNRLFELVEEGYPEVLKIFVLFLTHYDSSTVPDHFAYVEGHRSQLKKETPNKIKLTAEIGLDQYFSTNFGDNTSSSIPYLPIGVYQDI